MSSIDEMTNSYLNPSDVSLLVGMFDRLDLLLLSLILLIGTPESVRIINCFVVQLLISNNFETEEKMSFFFLH